MKILAIRGRNLASLEGDFDVDYGRTLVVCRNLCHFGTDGSREVYDIGCHVPGFVCPYAAYGPGKRE